ncbi:MULTISPECIES: hypothetical protein [Xanthomonas]|nr:hypothetical protein [Xanthomonas arboricola]QDS16143.1 hypothetical protein FPL04_11205 [Xanthomonas arboricola]SOU07155.1 hypothetical protein LMG19144_02207 [Xanthomonas arboricola pv. fragariae]
MKHSEESLAHQIALGWIASLAILATTLLSMALFGMFSEADFIALRQDPGYDGVFVLKILSAVYLFSAIGVYAFGSSRIFRWVETSTAILAFLLMLLHHLSHWVAGQRIGLMSHLMDVLHHVSMGWVILNSLRWARLSRKPGAGKPD